LRPSISFSEWQSFRNGCKFRWGLDYLENHRYEPENKIYGIYLDFGTSIHEAIEHHKTREEPITEGSAKELFEGKFRELYAANRDKYRGRERAANHEEFVNAGKRIIEHLKACEELTSAEVVFNEHELKLPIEREDDVRIEFKGYIDMVIRTKDRRGKHVLYVVDFKTCSWGWDQEKKQDRDKQFQLFLYKHFLCKKFDIDPTQVRCAFVLLKRAPRKGDNAIEFFPVSAGPVSVQRALDEMNSDITLMSELVRTNGLKQDFKKCVDSFGGICPYAGTALCPGSKRDASRN